MARRMILPFLVLGRPVDHDDRRRHHRLADAACVTAASAHRRCGQASARSSVTKATMRWPLSGRARRSRRPRRPAGLRDKRRLDLGRADAAAGDLDRVVGAAMDVPVAVARRRWRDRRAPRCRANGSSRCRGSDRDRARRHGSCPARCCARTSSPMPAVGLPSASSTSTSMPEQRPGEGGRRHAARSCSTTGCRRRFPCRP